MRRVRRRQVLRLFAFALVLWLAADALTHGTCAHDLIAFARAGRSEVGNTSTHHTPLDQSDPGHCSCHWQYLPAVAPAEIGLELVASVASAPRNACPPVVERPLDRPPQPGN